MFVQNFVGFFLMLRTVERDMGGRRSSGVCRYVNTKG